MVRIRQLPDPAALSGHGSGEMGRGNELRQRDRHGVSGERNPAPGCPVPPCDDRRKRGKRACVYAGMSECLDPAVRQSEGEIQHLFPEVRIPCSWRQKIPSASGRRGPNADRGAGRSRARRAGGTACRSAARTGAGACRRGIPRRCGTACRSAARAGAGTRRVDVPQLRQGACRSRALLHHLRTAASRTGT